MPASKADDKQLKRNRANQRNFRARRQEYVAELEEKVKAFEASQVKASQHIQTAARIVVEENQILRRLLYEKLELSDEAISVYVSEVRNARREKQNGTQESTARSTTRQYNQDKTTSMVKKLFPMQQHHPEISTHNSRLHQVPQTVCNDTRPVPSSSLPANSHTVYDDRQLKNSGSTDNFDNKNPIQNKSMSNATPSTVSETSNSEPNFDRSTDRITCEEAAAIITGMVQGSADPEIYYQLGCSSNSTCNVRTTDVFELMYNRV